MIDVNIKALILDRDGTLIRHIEYLSNPADVELLPGVKDGIKVLKELGYHLFLHTNQSGVGRNYFKIEQVEECNRVMQNLLELGPNLFDRICIATEKPSDTIFYRKPSPKFAIEIMNSFGFEPYQVFHIGDRYSDLEVSINLGTTAIGVNTGIVDLIGELKGKGMLNKFQVMKDFNEVVQYFMRN